MGWVLRLIIERLVRWFGYSNDESGHRHLFQCTSAAFGGRGLPWKGKPRINTAGEPADGLFLVNYKCGCTPNLKVISLLREKTQGKVWEHTQEVLDNVCRPCCGGRGGESFQSFSMDEIRSLGLTLLPAPPVHTRRLIEWSLLGPEFPHLGVWPHCTDRCTVQTAGPGSASVLRSGPSPRRVAAPGIQVPWSGLPNSDCSIFPARPTRHG